MANHRRGEIDAKHTDPHRADTRTGARQPYPTQRGLLTTYNAEWNARLAYWRVQEARKDPAAAHNDDIELRVEIMDALMAEGKERHVAANLTSTPAKMTAEGRRLGIL